jgi:hypothetical protein
LLEEPAFTHCSFQIQQAAADLPELPVEYLGSFGSINVKESWELAFLPLSSDPLGTHCGEENELNPVFLTTGIFFYQLSFSCAV